MSTRRMNRKRRVGRVVNPNELAVLAKTEKGRTDLAWTAGDSSSAALRIIAAVERDSQLGRAMEGQAWAGLVEHLDTMSKMEHTCYRQPITS